MGDGTVFYSMCGGMIFAAILLPFIDGDSEGRERLWVDSLVTAGLIIIIFGISAGCYYLG